MSLGKFRKALEWASWVKSKAKKYAPNVASMLGYEGLASDLRGNEYTIPMGNGLDVLVRKIANDTDGHFSLSFTASGVKPRGESNAFKQVADQLIKSNTSTRTAIPKDITLKLDSKDITGIINNAMNQVVDTKVKETEETIKTLRNEQESQPTKINDAQEEEDQIVDNTQSFIKGAAQVGQILASQLTKNPIAVVPDTTFAKKLEQQAKRGRPKAKNKAKVTKPKSSSGISLENMLKTNELRSEGGSGKGSSW